MGQAIIRRQTEDGSYEYRYWSGTTYTPVDRVIRNVKTGETRGWNGTAWVALAGPERTPIQEAMGIFSTGIERGLAAVGGLPHAIGEGIAQPAVAPGDPREAIYGTAEQRAQLGGAIQQHTLSPAEIEARYRELTGVPPTEPTEASGRVLQAAGMGAGAGVIGGPAGVVGGALAGTGAQTAAELDAPEWVQHLAGLGLPLVFGGISSMVRRIAPASQKQLGQALQGVTREELFAAENAMRQAQQAGNPITWSEALNQVSGGRYPQLAQLQRVVEQSPGGDALNRVMTGRLDAARQQAGGALDQIGPRLQGEALEAVPRRTQQAAQNVIEGERDLTNQLSRPAYEATTGTRTVVIPQQTFDRLVQDNPALTDAVAAVRADPIRYGNLQNAADNSFAVLDATKKYLDDIAGEARQGGARFAAENAGTLSNRVRDAMIAQDPRYASALNIQSIRQRNVEEPLRQGPVGQIADAPPTLSAQREKLLPVGKQETVNPQSVATTVARLEREAPGSARDWLRANLESQFDDVLRALQSAGSDQSRGASLWASLVGNETKAANLRAYVEALPNGQQTWTGFERVLATLDAQRYRLPANSATAFNQETVRALQGKSIPLSLEDLNPVSLFAGELKEAGKLRRYRINSQSLAQTLLDPNARSQLARLATLNPSTREARRLFASILATATTGNEAPER